MTIDDKIEDLKELINQADPVCEYRSKGWWIKQIVELIEEIHKECQIKNLNVITAEQVSNAVPLQVNSACRSVFQNYCRENGLTPAELQLQQDKHPEKDWTQWAEAAKAIKFPFPQDFVKSAPKIKGHNNEN